jgi:hypothetical protein
VWDGGNPAFWRKPFGALPLRVILGDFVTLVHCPMGWFQIPQKVYSKGRFLADKHLVFWYK